MRRFSGQPVLLAIVLSTLALLAGASSGRAGYIPVRAQVSSRVDADPISLIPSSECQAGGEWTAPAADEGAPKQTTPTARALDGLFIAWGLEQFGLRAQSSAGSASGGATSASSLSGQCVGPVEKPDVSDDSSSNPLDTEARSRLPPALASRLFRPPREAA
jgi:hypothetical protein